MFTNGTNPLYVNSDCLRVIMSHFDKYDPFTVVNFSRTCWSAKLLTDELYATYLQVPFVVRAIVDFDAQQVSYVARPDVKLLRSSLAAMNKQLPVMVHCKNVASNSPYIQELLGKLHYGRVTRGDVTFRGSNFDRELAVFAVEEVLKSTKELQLLRWAHPFELQDSPTGMPYKISVSFLKKEDYISFLSHFASITEADQDSNCLLEAQYKILNYVYEKEGACIYAETFLNTCTNVVQLIRCFMKKASFAAPQKPGRFTVSFKLLDEENVDEMFERLGTDELEDGLIRNCEDASVFLKRLTLLDDSELDVAEKMQPTDGFRLYIEKI